MRSPHLIRVLLISLTVFAGLLNDGAISAATAPVDTGVGISASPVAAAEPIAAGSSELLGPVVVANTGSSAATVGLRVDPYPDGLGNDSSTGDLGSPVPAEWVSFSPSEVPLDGGARASVDVRLDLPEDAPQGDYRSIIVANVTVTGSAGASGIGAEAATELRFTVTDPPPEPTRDPGPVVLLVAVTAGLVLVVATAWRRRRLRPGAPEPRPDERPHP